MHSIDHLRNTALLIARTNRRAVIGGSLSLVLQGYEVRRKPEDVDIMFTGPKESFVTPKGLKELPPYRESNEQDLEDYPEDSLDPHFFTPKPYEFEGVKVDILFTSKPFTPEPENIAYISAKNFYSKYRFKLCSAKYIIDRKTEYAFCKGKSSKKHKKDIAFFMKNNKLENLKQT